MKIIWVWFGFSYYKLQWISRMNYTNLHIISTSGIVLGRSETQLAIFISKHHFIMQKTIMKIMINLKYIINCIDLLQKKSYLVLSTFHIFGFNMHLKFNLLEILESFLFYINLEFIHEI